MCHCECACGDVVSEGQHAAAAQSAPVVPVEAGLVWQLEDVLHHGAEIARGGGAAEVL